MSLLLSRCAYTHEERSASRCGIVGEADLTAYCSSKSGPNGLTKALADEGRACGVRCNAVCPGGVATRLRAETHPDEDPSTILQPIDVANVVLFLASDLSRYVTGQAIEVSLPNCR